LSATRTIQVDLYFPHFCIETRLPKILFLPKIPSSGDLDLLKICLPKSAFVSHQKELIMGGLHLDWFAYGNCPISRLHVLVVPTALISLAE
jgi:hypothetical protein